MALQLKKMEPLYKQMHAYVRKKLIGFYNKENINRDGPIPAHLLGDVYAQRWVNIYPVVVPYPESGSVPNVTEAMNNKNMDVIDMFIMAENFFTSIGLKKMTPHFWHYSMIEKPENRNVECHPSAHDFNNGKDFRIKMCTSLNSRDLDTVHHEMGHIQYYMHCSHLTFIFRSSANPGFHEAIGDAISLSILTPDYLSKVGLMKKSEIKKDKKSTINFLMQIALRYAVLPAYSYIIDHWRNQVFNGTIKDSELNEKYWVYRLQFQGVCPPLKRTEENFDVGAKFHIANITLQIFCCSRYTKYFVKKQVIKDICMNAISTKRKLEKHLPPFLENFSVRENRKNGR